METWANAFGFFLLNWWCGVTFALCFHFFIYWVSAKYAANFDGKND